MSTAWRLLERATYTACAAFRRRKIPRVLGTDAEGPQASVRRRYPGRSLSSTEAEEEEALYSALEATKCCFKLVYDFKSVKPFPVLLVCVHGRNNTPNCDVDLHNGSFTGKYCSKNLQSASN